jgi:hypothetical protein
MNGQVFPIFMGMVRLLMGHLTQPPRSPHLCGDGPLSVFSYLRQAAFSPPPWG